MATARAIGAFFGAIRTWTGRKQALRAIAACKIAGGSRNIRILAGHTIDAYTRIITRDQ
jgi:hypothetical protein